MDNAKEQKTRRKRDGDAGLSIVRRGGGFSTPENTKKIKYEPKSRAQREEPDNSDDDGESLFAKISQHYRERSVGEGGDVRTLEDEQRELAGQERDVRDAMEFLHEDETETPRKINQYVGDTSSPEGSVIGGRGDYSRHSSSTGGGGNPYGVEDNDEDSQAREMRAIFDGDRSGVADEFLDNIFDNPSQVLPGGGSQNASAILQEPMHQEEVDENEDEAEEEEDQVERACSQIAAAKKITKGHTSIAKDSEKAAKAELDAIVERINELKRAGRSTAMLPIAALIIEDEDQIEEEVVDVLRRLITSRQMELDAQVFLAWKCSNRRKYVVEDGRHRLRALNDAVDRINERRGEEEKVDKRKVMVRVQVIEGGKVAARVWKMSAVELTCPTVFEKAIDARLIMDHLEMLDNPYLSMQLRAMLINEHIRGLKKGRKKGKASSGGGLPMYIVQAACLPDDEFEFIKKNVRTFNDCCALLTLYQQARAVFPERALEILQRIDDESCKEAAKVEYQNLSEMHNSIADLLKCKGYAEADAMETQDRVYKSSESFYALRSALRCKPRLTLSKAELENVLLEMERCLPPVTFVRPHVKVFRSLDMAPSTLFILDAQVFQMEHNLKGLVNIVHDKRNVNFLVVGLPEEKVKEVTNGAFEKVRREKRRSASQHPQYDVGAASISVQCAQFDQMQGATWVPTTVIQACLMRATNGEMMGPSSLGEFMTSMQMAGAIGRTCLRLLTFDATLEVSNHRGNAVFVHGTTIDPFAVAARASCHRVNMLMSTNDRFKRELQEKQGAMKNDWQDYSKYRGHYTSEGKIKEVTRLVKSRNRASKVKQAVERGILPSKQ